MTPLQLAYLESRMENRKVDDLGCGRTKLAPILHKFDYLGIDKESFDAPNTVQFDLSQPCPHLRRDIAFVSWPVNWPSIAWSAFLSQYSDVFYLGSNHSGTCCGDMSLWELLSKREVCEVIPDFAETLIHYISRDRENNAPAPLEEVFGISVWQGKAPAEFCARKFR